jgi:hypothetical protein
MVGVAARRSGGGGRLARMDWLTSVKLIRLFDFYLALTFLVSTAVRVSQYRLYFQVVRAVPSRWPRLFQLVKQYKHLFLTWGTILPLVITLSLWLTNTLLRRVVLSGQEDLTVGRLAQMGVALAAVVFTGLAMLCFDLYGTFRVAKVDRELLDKYFDQAEYWLRSWAAPVLRVFTLGYVNPRKMVHEEVRKALVNASRLLNSSLWWMSIQALLRIAFGLALWVSYAFSLT